MHSLRRVLLLKYSFDYNQCLLVFKTAYDLSSFIALQFSVGLTFDSIDLFTPSARRLIGRSVKVQDRFFDE